MNTIDNAAVSNIKRVHDKDKDDGLQDSLASSLEGNPYQNYLCHAEEYYLERSHPHHQKDHNDYYHTHNRAC